VVTLSSDEGAIYIDTIELDIVGLFFISAIVSVSFHAITGPTNIHSGRGSSFVSKIYWRICFIHFVFIYP